jgi:putative transposase
MTPEVVHYGLAQEVFKAREKVLLAAYETHPERFVRKAPTPLELPQAAWINPPKSTMENENLLH